MQERSFDKYYVTFLLSCWNICIWVWVWVWVFFWALFSAQHKSHFSSTNWKYEHYFETLSALTLKIRTSFNHCFDVECWKHNPAFEVPRPNQSQHWSWLLVPGDIFRRSTGLANCAKNSMHPSVNLLPDSQIVQHVWCCNLSKCLQICSLLSMEWIWTCGLAHHHHFA